MITINYPRKNEQMRAANFAVSMVATMLFALQIADHISLPVLVIIMCLLAYLAVRICKNFAIPYSLVYATVLLIAYIATKADSSSPAGTSESSVLTVPDGGPKGGVRFLPMSQNRLQSPNFRRALSIIVLVLVAVMLVTTMMRFPVKSVTVSLTQPMRGESAVDDQAHMYLGESDLSLRGYPSDAGTTHDTVRAYYPTLVEGRVMETFYQYGLMIGGVSTESCDCQFVGNGTGSDLSPKVTPENATKRKSLLYDNEDDRIFFMRWDAT